MEHEKRDVLDMDLMCDGSVLLDGFERAIVGVVNSFEGKRILYDTSIILEILSKDGLSYEDCFEYYEYNILGGHFSDQNPIFLDFQVLPINENTNWKYEIIY